MCNELEKEGIDAIPLTGGQAGIITNNTFGDAKVLDVKGEKIKKILLKGKIPVICGFQGNTENEEFSVPEDFLNHVDEILHIWNGKQYDTIFYRAGSDNDPVQGFVMARCKKQVEEATVQYAFMNATPVTTKADSILISDITELIHSSLKLSDFQQDLNPNYPDTRFVFGYAHDKEIYSLEVEGQKPDGVIEINVYDRTMYLWYYDDLKSDKRGNNLSYSVDMPE